MISGEGLAVQDFGLCWNFCYILCYKNSSEDPSYYNPGIRSSSSPGSTRPDAYVVVFHVPSSSDLLALRRLFQALTLWWPGWDNSGILLNAFGVTRERALDLLAIGRTGECPAVGRYSSGSTTRHTDTHATFVPFV